MQVEEKRLKSPWPFYTIGVVWLLYGFFFPMYTLFNWVLAGGISVLVFVWMARLEPDTIIMVEKKVQPTGNDMADQYIAQGHTQVKQLHALNLAGTTLAQDKEKLAELASKIMDFVVKYPQKARQLNSFMDYYLPTAVTLLDQYQHLVSQEQLSDHIKASQENIEQAMPAMITAFEKQLDALFSDKALDISAEVSLLKDLLQREGLN